MRRLLPLLALCFLLGCQQQSTSSDATTSATPAQPAASATPAGPAATPAATPTAAAASPQAAAKKTAPGSNTAAQKPPDHPIQLADSPMGVVTFDHAKHKLDCVTCHHASRAEKPATAAEQACRSCHTKPPQPGMKTVRQAAFHNPSATAGTCIDCHKKSGGNAPTTCKQCHVKGA